MPRYALKIQYDGTDYVGYQVQPNGVSIQSVLEQGLRTIAKVDDSTRIMNTVSGRTDSGVHALGQVLHIDFPFAISPDSLRKALNSTLPTAIRVMQAVRVSEDFHARYHAVAKEYLYRVDCQDYPDPFKIRYTLHHPYYCDSDRISEAMQSIIGTHDFSSFCSTKTDIEDHTRTIYHASVQYDSVAEELQFRFHGNGFLYNMVRILVGTLLQIGDGLRPVSDMQRILQAKDRNQAGPTAPGHGLYLMRVEYPEDPFITSTDISK